MLKRIKLAPQEEPTIEFSEIDLEKPIFAKRDGNLAGMIIREQNGNYCLYLEANKASRPEPGDLYDCLAYFESKGYKFFQ